MERRQTDGAECTLEQNVEMILGAGYDGISASFTDAGAARRIAALIKPHGKVLEGQCFPRTIDELEPTLELCTELGVHHLDIQADVRPRRIADCVPLIEGWLRPAEEVDFPVYFETHRDRMTTDLYFTLDLLERFPELKLLGDLSHFLVEREFATPISEENHAYMHRVIDKCWGVPRPRRQPRAGADRDQFSASQDVARNLPGVVGVRIQELAPSGESRRHPVVRVRARPEALCDHRPRRQRRDRSLAGGSPDARPGSQIMERALMNVVR